MSEPQELLSPNGPLYVLLHGERFQVRRVDVGRLETAKSRRSHHLHPYGERYAVYPHEVVLGILYDPPAPEFPPGIGDNVLLGEN